MHPGAFNRLAPRIPIALLCLYAPYAWLVLISYPWNSYRLHWIKMWPILPGLSVHLIPGVHQQPDWVGYLTMGIVTTLILALVAYLSPGSRRQAIATFAVLGGLSILNSGLAYALFRD